MSDIVQRDEGVFEQLAGHLHVDGFSPKAVADLCGKNFELYQLAIGQNVADVVGTYNADDILSRAMEIFNAAQLLPVSEREQLSHLIGDVLRKELLNNVYAMAGDCRVKNFFRYRSVILQWITPQEYQSIISRSVDHYLEKNTLGPLGDFSLYAALYFPQLQQELPDPEPLMTNILHVIQGMNRWVPLFATTPPSSLDSGISFGRDFQHTDEIIEVAGVQTAKRCDKRFTDCVPQADTAHFQTSLSDTRGRNTYVFSQGRLLGSLKHSEDDLGRQKTFLGMRTIVCSNDASGSGKPGTYPVIEGGLYLVSDWDAAQNIMSRGDRCDIDELSLMPLRSTESLVRVPHEKYLERIRNIRTELEKT